MKLKNPIIRIPMPIKFNDPAWPINCRQAFPSYYISLFLILLIASLLPGCGTSGGGGKNDSSGSNTEQVSGIDTTGGSVTSNDAKTKVLIPSGALNKTTDISVAVTSAVPTGNILSNGIMHSIVTSPLLFGVYMMALPQTAVTTTLPPTYGLSEVDSRLINCGFDYFQTII